MSTALAPVVGRSSTRKSSTPSPSMAPTPSAVASIELDAEAQCVNALLWAPATTVTRIAEHLGENDFYRPDFGAVCTVITRLAREGRAHTAALVAAELHRGAGTRSDYLHRALLDVVVGDARAHDAGYYALAVLAQSYRRGYTTAAARLAHIAETADETELFEQMCVLGRERRAARDRLHAAISALTGSPSPGARP